MPFISVKGAANYFEFKKLATGQRRVQGYWLDPQ
jgi:hypothetical protein